MTKRKKKTNKKTLFDFRDGNRPVPAHQHPNGGGWIAETATVEKSAFVGPWIAAKDCGDSGYMAIYDTNGHKIALVFDDTAEVIAQVPEMLEILKKLSRLCPSAEGLGGHAPLSAFHQVAWEARRLITKQQEIR